ncbi:DUF502 domain-containing protein [Halovenus sp. WSH3]|uniref:DUF502 domain-containing protein n=1 Tax=Halovenus carboxidivorans TaxID=2692199 RepID=A0A6B0TAM6_9EURY|nr:DUF502 domain-containing protein [Halovenus carboxidivorans]MXR52442.1 DUF502 domain-containing protein [Halovenus carboxidivorans]
MPILTAAGKKSRRNRLRDLVRASLIRGTVLIVPLVLTLIILGFVANFIFSRINPLVSIVESLLGLPNIPTWLVEITVLICLVGLILLIGLVSLEWKSFDRVENAFDDLMTSIPGVGPIYSSFNEMSELLLDSQSQSFKDVKLVEYPTDDSYALAFVTADTPDYIEEGAGHEEMVTLFMPMAPNPVMGGFVISVDRERVVDVDISVQQGIQAIVTSGVSLGSKSMVPEDGDALSDFQVEQDAQPPVVNAAEQIDGSADSAEGTDGSTDDS